MPRGDRAVPSGPKLPFLASFRFFMAQSMHEIGAIQEVFMIVTRSLRILVSSVLLLGPSAIGRAQSDRSPSNCDGPGPYALRINEDLLREDVQEEAMEAPPMSRTERKPGQERQAL